MGWLSDYAENFCERWEDDLGGKMKVIILGFDGYLGKATAFHLAEHGHEVIGVDNYYKRHLLAELHIRPLYDVPRMEETKNLFKHHSGKEIKVFYGGEEKFYEMIRRFQPDAVIHYAEQPSAPYSMMGEEQGLDTVFNNISTNMRLVYAIAKLKPDIHIIKLGSMGTYGTPNVPIPEGWFDCAYRGRTDRMLFPRKPHSIYHLSKVHDSDLLAFATRVWGLRATDLHQGIVYGITTGDYSDSLKPRFCYDDLFGTALNRFVTQAVAGIPLTVYGSGGQTRGWLNIKDTVECLRLALENPAKEGEYRIFNQFTEQHSVLDIANLVSKVTKAKIAHIDNPRTEMEDHFYEADHQGLKDLGLEPHLLTGDVVEEMVKFVARYKENIRKEQIMPKVTWEGGHAGYGT